ncbi:hypothetical protein ACFL03_06575 [Thermodesulfobacteriota bacterium]
MKFIKTLSTPYFFTFLCVVTLTCNAIAQDDLYQELASQLQQGKPIVITSYIGLWYDRQDEPERNLYWGKMAGHYFLFSKSKSIQHLPHLYRNNKALEKGATNISSAIVHHLHNYQWDEVYFKKNDADPKRIAVFKLTVEPNEFWLSKGIENAFPMYNVMLAYSDMEKCMNDMVHHLKQEKAPILKWDQGEIDLGKESQVMGYIGHNIYYGGTCTVDNLESLPYISNEKKGVFFLGCQSSRWCTEKFTTPQVTNLLFCKTNMAPEGYIMLALLDGISRGISGDKLVTLSDRVYGIAQGQGPDIRLFNNDTLETQNAPTSHAPSPAPDFPVSSPVEVAKSQNVAKLREAYPATKEEVKAKQDEFRARKETASSDEEKARIMQEGRNYLFEILTDRIFPAWCGTPWDYNGTTREPGKGQIACGTFVIYALQDAGFKIPSKMARQPSENIIKNLTDSSHVKRFSNSAPMERVLRWILLQGEGLFIVGLDEHVGFIINKNGKTTFCHSNYKDPPLMVVNQDAMEKSPLTDSKYRVLGKILDDEMMIKWLEGEPFPLTYDYFRRAN